MSHSPISSTPSEPILVGAGALGTLGTLLVTLGIHYDQISSHRSETYLEQTLKLTEIAVITLERKENNMIEWIKAAKLLEVAQKLAKKVSEEAHRIALTGFMESYRARIFSLLEELGSQSTPAFFYGAKNLSTAVDDAAAEATTPRDGILSKKQIPESAIKIIDDFAKHFAITDLPERRYSKREMRFLRVLRPVLYDYLDHTDKYKSSNGQLEKRNPPLKRT